MKIGMNTLNQNVFKARQPYFDFLKGIAIIFVVAIHSFSHVYTKENLSLFAIIVRQLMNVAVPIFCVSSAYFLAKKEGRKEGRSLFLKQFIRVFIPLLFFSMPYFILDIINNKNIIVSFIKLITGSYSVYYFIFLIIQFYALLSLFSKSSFFRNKLIGFAISFIWVFAYNYLIRPYYELPLIIYGGIIFCFWVYFSIGSSIEKVTHLEKNKFLFYIVILLVALALSVFESFHIMKSNSSLTGVGLKPSSVIFSTLIVLILFSPNMVAKYKQNVIFKIVETLGKFSLGIYLGHLFIQMIILKAITYFSINLVLSKGFLSWTLFTGVILLCTFACLFIVKKIIPKVSRLFLGV